MTPFEKLDHFNSKLQEFLIKLNEMAKQQDSENNATNIAATARDVVSISESLRAAAFVIATSASVKEQADYDVEIHSQKTENFAAMLQRREPKKIQIQRKKPVK